MGAHQSKRYSDSEVCLSPLKDGTFFDITFGKRSRHYNKQNSEEDSQSSHKNKKGFEDPGAPSTPYTSNPPSPHFLRPRAKTISQAYPSLAFWRLRHSHQPYVKEFETSAKDRLPAVFRWKCPKMDKQGVGKLEAQEHHKSHPKTVSIVGSWDGWKKRLPLVFSEEHFAMIIELPEGTHHYRFLVDNEWTYDDKLPSSTENGTGFMNNILEVKKSDFEVFDALADDLASGQDSNNRYSKDIPSPKLLVDWDRLFCSSSNSAGSQNANGGTFSGPPILPPQLLQVILNKDIPYHYEPELLPEPNHVMINHLYALSIKDGVMVMSCTHRHNKKYVTTLLYKPVVQ
ncbi:unnamed protein product [Gordionus sp. m RMFG-2023]